MYDIKAAGRSQNNIILLFLNISLIQKFPPISKKPKKLIYYTKINRMVDDFEPFSRIEEEEEESEVEQKTRKSLRRK